MANDHGVAVGNFFFAGVASFSVLFVTQRYGLSTPVVDALAPVVALSALLMCFYAICFAAWAFVA